MSILNNFARPSVEFDVNNVEHRQHYLKFIQTNSWGKCPVRFKVDPQYTDVVSTRLRDSRNLVETRTQVFQLERFLRRET